MQTRHNEEELSNVYIRSETIVKGKKSLRHALLLMRPWAFTLLFLLATEVSLRMEMPKLIVCDRQIRDCRTYYDFLHLLGTKHQAMHFKFFLETIQKNDPQSFKIYFLGDSIVLGNAPFKKSVDEKRDDIALTLEEELHKRFPGKKINIYNIASLGEGEYSSFEMLKILVDFKPDFILKNVNFRNYNDFIYTTRQEIRTAGNAGEAKIAQQNSNKRSLGNIDNFLALWKSFNRFPLEEKAKLTGAIFENFLYNHSMLYGSRDYLSFFIFRGPKIRQLERLSEAFKQKKTSEFSNKTVDIIPLTEDKAIGKIISLNYNFPKLEFSSRPLIFSEEIVNLVESQNIPALFFMSPINHRLVDQFIEQELIFKTNMEIISSIYEKINYRNFNESLPAEDFRDSDHLTEKGNRDLARLIADEVAPDLEKLFSRRRTTL